MNRGRSIKSHSGFLFHINTFTFEYHRKFKNIDFALDEIYIYIYIPVDRLP